ncbi:hypothetical protein [Halopiger djelfimassiliensis]|uniref:hypothetical protein n=1 Tax=Halopiger djelfimassiliensis TaxID=1293047 RepID=UPI0006775AE7|nr:hypothetical protein [Halopiger djelfimassiliensis]
MRSARIVLVVFALVGGIGIGFGVAAGAPPPTPLCGICDSDIPGTTGAGTLDIQLDSSGDSRWTERVPVTESAADRYRESTGTLERTVDNGSTRWHIADDDRTDRTVALEGKAIVVSYTVEDVARPGVGDSWLVDYFATGTSKTRYQLAAERVSIHAPEDTVVTNSPPGATVDGNTATWQSRADGAFESDFDDQTYITYGPDGLPGVASSYATIGLEIGPTAISDGLVGGFVPATALVLAGFAVGRVTIGLDAFDAETLERLLVSIGVVGALGIGVVGAATVGIRTPGPSTLAMLGVGYAILGAAATRLGPRLETRGLLGLAALVTVLVGLFARLLSGSPVSLLPLLFGLVTALFLPIGYAFERGRRPLALIGLTGLVPMLIVAANAPLSTLQSFLVVVFILLPWVVAVAVFGYPLALLGRKIARSPS